MSIIWSSKNYTSEDIIKLLDVLEELPTTFDLSHNNIIDTEFLNVPILSTIKSLNLSYNNIINPINIASSIVILDISNNKVEDSGLIYFINLVNLISLNISYNNITSLIDKKYKTCYLTFLNNLIYLYISYNKLETIDGLQTLNKLTKVDVSYNQITDLSELSDTINIKELNIVGNPIVSKNIVYKSIYPKINIITSIELLKDISTSDLTFNKNNNLNIQLDIINLDQQINNMKEELPLKGKGLLQRIHTVLQSNKDKDKESNNSSIISSVNIPAIITPNKRESLSLSIQRSLGKIETIPEMDTPVDTPSALLSPIHDGDLFDIVDNQSLDSARNSEGSRSLTSLKSASSISNIETAKPTPAKKGILAPLKRSSIVSISSPVTGMVSSASGILNRKKSGVLPKVPCDEFPEADNELKELEKLESEKLKILNEIEDKKSKLMQKQRASIGNLIINLESDENIKANKAKVNFKEPVEHSETQDLNTDTSTSKIQVIANSHAVTDASESYNLSKSNSTVDIQSLSKSNSYVDIQPTPSPPSILKPIVSATLSRVKSEFKPITKIEESLNAKDSEIEDKSSIQNFVTPKKDGNTNRSKTSANKQNSADKRGKQLSTPVGRASFYENLMNPNFKYINPLTNLSEKSATSYSDVSITPNKKPILPKNNKEKENIHIASLSDDKIVPQIDNKTVPVIGDKLDSDNKIATLIGDKVAALARIFSINKNKLLLKFFYQWFSMLSGIDYIFYLDESLLFTNNNFCTNELIKNLLKTKSVLEVEAYIDNKLNNFSGKKFNSEYVRSLNDIRVVLTKLSQSISTSANSNSTDNKIDTELIAKNEQLKIKNKSLRAIFAQNAEVSFIFHQSLSLMKIIFRNNSRWEKRKRIAFNKWKISCLNVFKSDIQPSTSIAEASSLTSKIKLHSAFFHWYRMNEQLKSKDMIKTMEYVASESDKNSIALLQMLSDAQAQRDSIKHNYKILQDDFSAYIEDTENKFQNLALIAEQRAADESKEFIQEIQASEILFRLKSFIFKKSDYLKRRSMRKWYKISKLPESLTSLSLSNSYDSLVGLSKLPTINESPIGKSSIKSNPTITISKSPYIPRESSSLSFEVSKNSILELNKNLTIESSKHPIVKSSLPPRPSTIKK